MYDSLYRLTARFARHGLLHRERVKNDLVWVRRLLRSGFLKKVYKKRQVFYELTRKALPLLELQRRRLLEEVRLRQVVTPGSLLYESLLSDLRFLDDEKPEAREFLFLGDWQLLRPVLSTQLDLAKFRYYQDQNLS